MTGEHLALLSLSATLLGTLVLSTWRFSSLATKLLSTVTQLEKKDSELEARTKAIDSIPALEMRVGMLEKNHSMIPKLGQEIEVLKAHQQHSKEMRAVTMRRSRPEIDDE